jgi:hypothetical protein
MTFLRIVIPLYHFVCACPFSQNRFPTFAGHALAEQRLPGEARPSMGPIDASRNRCGFRPSVKAQQGSAHESDGDSSIRTAGRFDL